jgi:hypothetical protein
MAADVAADHSQMHQQQQQGEAVAAAAAEWQEPRIGELLLQLRIAPPCHVPVCRVSYPPLSWFVPPKVFFSICAGWLARHHSNL